MQNGKKIKHLPPTLKIKDFKRGKGLTREALEEIFEGTRKTLRLLVSKAASLYDPTGITSALIGQLRDVVRVATLHTQGQYEQEVPDTMWSHFLDCLYEALMVASYAYQRITDQNIIERGLIFLIGSVDASFSQILFFHLSHPNSKGERSINHCISKSYLSHDNGNCATEPRKELSALTLGAVLFSVRKKELGKRLGQAIICSDSKIVIHWSTRGSEQLQTIHPEQGGDHKSPRRRPRRTALRADQVQPGGSWDQVSPGGGF